MGHHCGKSCQKSKQGSTAVKTDPDRHGIPASWLILHQRLVREIYIGLTNIVNTLYHSESGYCSAGDGKAAPNPPSMEFFHCQDGCWKSKLLPQVEITAGDRQVNWEDFKNELYSLLEKATKLQDCIPYVMEMDQKDSIVAEKSAIVSFCKNESKETAMAPSGSGTYGSQEDANCTPYIMETDQRKNSIVAEKCAIESFCMNESKETAMAPSRSGTSGNQEDANSCTSLSKKSEKDPVASGSTMRSQTMANGPVAKKPAVHVVSSKKYVRFNDKAVQGVDVSKFNLPQRVSKCVEMAVPKQHHASKKPLHQVTDMTERIRKDSNQMNINRNDLLVAGGKITRSTSKGTASRWASGEPSRHVHDKAKITSVLNGRQNFIAEDKSGCSSKECKNFIKINILLSKFPMRRGHKSVIEVHRGAAINKSISNKPSKFQERRQPDKRIQK